MSKIGADFNFDHGLTGVSIREGDTPRLPDSAPLAPSENAPAEELGKLDCDPGLSDPLRHSLVPDLPDPAMLRPERFQDISRRTVTDAREAAAELNPGADRQSFRKMARLLEDMQSDTALLDALRGALYKG